MYNVALFTCKAFLEAYKFVKPVLWQVHDGLPGPLPSIFLAAITSTPVAKDSLHTFFLPFIKEKKHFVSDCYRSSKAGTTLRLLQVKAKHARVPEWQR